MWQKCVNVAVRDMRVAGKCMNVAEKNMRVAEERMSVAIEEPCAWQRDAWVWQDCSKRYIGDFQRREEFDQKNG